MVSVAFAGERSMYAAIDQDQSRQVAVPRVAAEVPAGVGQGGGRPPGVTAQHDAAPAAVPRGHHHLVQVRELTLAEVKAALRPHLLDHPGWEQLRDAAAAWEAARREARPLLSAAVRARGEEWRRLSGLYDAAVTAANNAYRAQHEQAAGNGGAAA